MLSCQLERFDLARPVSSTAISCLQSLSYTLTERLHYLCVIWFNLACITALILCCSCNHSTFLKGRFERCTVFFYKQPESDFWSKIWKMKTNTCWNSRDALMTTIYSEWQNPACRRAKNPHKEVAAASICQCSRISAVKSGM